MASIRKRPRADGTVVYSVLYRLDGRQTSAPFPTRKAAEHFRDQINSGMPARRVMEIWGIGDTKGSQNGLGDGLTLAEWLDTYLESLTGIEAYTRQRYATQVQRDINPHLGFIPLTEVSETDVARWVNIMQMSGAGGKTIRNKHAFLSAALNEAVRRHLINANPCLGRRLPRWDRREMTYLTREEYAKLKSVVPPFWQPFIEFLVTSGARFGEATALQPADVDRLANTVRITRAWKHGRGPRITGLPKTDKSRRTINVPARVLDQLDYSREWLFLNTKGTPIKPAPFYKNVWKPTLEKLHATGSFDKRPRVHDLRHTCASWMIQAGISESVVQEHLGHESIETTTAMYRHLDRRSFEAAAAAIESYIS